MERIGSQIMIAFRMPLEEPLNCRAQRHWFHRFVQDNVACHAGPVPRVQCRIAADEEGWNFCIKFALQVLDYIEKEDTPRSLTYQLEVLRAVGFRTVEVLHKNSCFAAFGAVK